MARREDGHRSATPWSPHLKKTHPHTLWVLALVGTLLLAACGVTSTAGPGIEPGMTQAPGPTSPPAAASPEPVTLRVGTTYIWDTANPATGSYNDTLRYLLYDTLVEEAGISNFVPGLAEDWSVSGDGLVWTFKIREGVTFHDGTPCTADDVAWSLNWTIENEIETLSFYLANFAEIVALDPTTLQVTLSDPVGDMAYRLMYVWILPRSVWEGMSHDEILEFEDLSAGIGTGPYKLVDWVEGEYLLLEANKDYWRGAPHLDQVVWQEYASEDATIQALLAGEIDAIASGTIPSAAIQTLEEAEGVEVPIMDSTGIDELIINSHEKGTQPASLRDPEVRRAIAHAIDKKQIANAAYLGYADPATVIIPRSMGDWHNSDVQDIPFDPQEGNRILDRAGYLDEDRDGIREDENGNPLEYRLYGTEDATAARILEIISEGLAHIGILVLPTPMGKDSLASLYPDFDFDLIYWGWSLAHDPGMAMSIFTCGQRKARGWNDSGYCDEEFDEMYQQQAVTVDHQARRWLIWDMQQKLFDERPYIVLTYLKTVQAYRSDRFTGFGLKAGDILWKASFLPVRPVE